MANFIVAGILLLMVGAASAFLIRAKKKGIKCIGCPSGGCCSKCAGCTPKEETGINNRKDA